VIYEPFRITTVGDKRANPMNNPAKLTAPFVYDLVKVPVNIGSFPTYAISWTN